MLPKFLIRGHLNSTSCIITQPLTGELVVESSEAAIRSIELQLVRVETCGEAHPAHSSGRCWGGGRERWRDGGLGTLGAAARSGVCGSSQSQSAIDLLDVG